MTNDKKEAPSGLDPSKLKFPTDRITLGQMRTAEPGEGGLDDIEAKYSQLGGSEALSAHKLELHLAHKAYAKAVGQPEPSPNLRRDEIADILGQVYSDYKLSTGPAMTAQLLRDIETAAAAQATAKGR